MYEVHVQPDLWSKYWYSRPRYTPADGPLQTYPGEDRAVRDDCMLLQVCGPAQPSAGMLSYLCRALSPASLPDPHAASTAPEYEPYERAYCWTATTYAPLFVLQ